MEWSVLRIGRRRGGNLAVLDRVVFQTEVEDTLCDLNKDGHQFVNEHFSSATRLHSFIGVCSMYERLPVHSPSELSL